MNMPANRVAALAAFLAGLAGLVGPLAGAFEGSDAGAAIVAVGGLVTILATVLKFLAGAQAHEARRDAPVPLTFGQTVNYTGGLDEPDDEGLAEDDEDMGAEDEPGATP